MARKQSKKKQPKQKKERSLPAWMSDRERLARVSGVVLTVLLGAAIAVGLVAGRREMQARVAERRASQTVRIVFDWPRMPNDRKRTWMDADSRRDLQAIAISWLEQDPWSPALLAAAQEALSQSGWFAGECTLKREPGGVIRVSGRWRIPAAVVRTGDRDRLVAATGERLAPEYPVDTSGRKVILGVDQAAPPGLGQRWTGSGGGVRAAIDLLAFIGGTPGAHQVHGIDVSRYADRRELTLVTDRGTRVLWGGPIDAFMPGQAPPAEKRDRLARVFARFGRIDAGSTSIDISLEHGVELEQTVASASGP